MTQTGLSLGTPQSMSPEQAMGEKTIDARSDVYALGAVTYEMLVGDAPFTGDTTLHTVFDMPSVQFALSIALSPDGQWLAYSSSESEGSVKVYVASFPDARATGSSTTSRPTARAF